MSNRYELVIYWSADDDCFVVEVPELPGCMSDGSSWVGSGFVLLFPVRSNSALP